MQEQYRLMYLAHARSASFRRKVADATSVLEEFLGMCERPYVGFSGGKDSTAVLVLLSRMGCTDIPIFTQGDDLDYPDKKEHCERVVSFLGFTDYTYDYSDVSAMAQLWERDDEQISGTFTHVAVRFRNARQRDGVIMGLRAEESRGRKKLVQARGPIYERGPKKGENGRTLCCLPLYNWRGEDVFALILSSGVPYMHVYDHDDDCLPHEIRFSWMTSPEFWRWGDVMRLRRYYPDLYAKLASVYPAISRYT